MRWLALFLLSCLPASCAFECGPESCAAGCCDRGVCYLGAGVRGAAACGAPDAGQQPITRRDAGTDGGAAACLGELYVCSSSSSQRCCSKSGSGAALSCKYEVCQVDCADYGDPCNSSIPCCRANPATNAHDYLCVGERCTYCLTPKQDCSDSFQRSKCCPGTQCLLKPGFSTVYECQ